MITRFLTSSPKKPIHGRFYRGLKPIGSNSNLLLAVFWICFTTIAYSQEHKYEISFPEAIKKTLNSHPELKSFSHQYKANQGMIKQSRLATRKEINVNIEDFAGTKDHEGINSMQSTLSVSWVLENDLLSSRFNLANSTKGLIESDEKIKRFELASQTAGLFIQALGLQEQVKVINKAIKFSESAVKEINKKVIAGKSFRADLLRAQAELSKQKLIEEDLKHEIKIAYRNLAAQWGERSLNDASLIGSLSINNTVVSFDFLKNQLNQNPQVNKIATLNKINDSKLELAIAENKSRWKFMTGLRRYERADDVALVAGFTLPIGGKNRSEGKVEEIKAYMSQDNSDHEALKISLETSLFAYYQLMMHNVHLAEILSNDIIPKLKEAQNKTYEAYLIGRYGYLDLKNVQDDLIDAHLTLLEAKLNFHLNKIEIEAITGSQLFSTTEGM